MTRRLIQCAALALALSGASQVGRADTADADWEALIALDTGPQTKARTSEEARAVAVAHLARQEKALREFIGKHATDSRIFEAQLRLVQLLQLRESVQGAPKAMAEARTLLERLEKSATPGQRPDVDFTRVTVLMRSLKTPGAAERRQLLNAARNFQRNHPRDRRIAGLLTEVARLFPSEPGTMRALLLDARAVAEDDTLKAQIADDLQRIDRLGKIVELRFTSVQGQPFDLADARGSVVCVVFFAVWSEPSVQALDQVQRALARLPRGQARAIGVSLDTKIEPLSALLQKKQLTWPVACDGRGWEGPLVRSLGINSLPTVWLIDRKGRLRSLEGLSGTESQMRQLLNER